MSDRDEMMTTRMCEHATVAEVLAQMVEQNRAAARDLAELARRVEVEAADARRREAGLTARLGEVEGELAEAVAELETEKTKRVEAERALTGHATAIDQMRRIFAGLPAESAAHASTAETAVEPTDQDPSSTKATSEYPVSATGRGTTSEAPSADDHAEPNPGAAATKRTIPMTLDLAQEEAAALDAHAARAGFADGRAVAVHLIREGLRRAGMLAAEKLVPAIAGVG